MAIFPFGRMNGASGAASSSIFRLIRLENAVIDPSGNFALAVVIEFAINAVVGRDINRNAAVLPDPTLVAKLRLEAADAIADGQTVAIGTPMVVSGNVLMDMLKLDMATFSSFGTQLE